MKFLWPARESWVSLETSHWTIVTLQVNTDWCWRNSLWLTRHIHHSGLDVTRDTDHGEAAEQNCSRGMGIYFAMTFKEGSDHGFRLEPIIAQIKSFLPNVGQNIDSWINVRMSIHLVQWIELSELGSILPNLSSTCCLRHWDGRVRVIHGHSFM